MKQKDISPATKKELAAALKQLMAHKPLTGITIRELSQACNLNRNSFYYHFEDIFALFKWMLEEEAVDVVRQYDLMTDYRDVINFVLDYVEGNDYLLLNAYNAIGQAGLKRFLYLDFIDCIGELIYSGAQRQGITLDANYRQFLCSFYSEAIAGTLLDYLTHPQGRSRETLLEYLERLLKSSLPAVVTGAGKSSAQVSRNTERA